MPDAHTPAQQPAPTGSRCAVRLPADPSMRSQLDSNLIELGITNARLFQTKDTHDLNWQANEGRFDRVVFASMSDLLEAVWNEEADVALWLKRGVRLDVLDRPAAGDGPGSTTSAVSIPEITESYSRWQVRRRKKRVLAGLMLSVFALAAMLMIFLSIPRP
mgnify:CR=1 FL=1